jgi:hypothetical protein
MPVGEVLGGDIAIGCPALSRAYATQLAAEAAGGSTTRILAGVVGVAEDEDLPPDDLAPGGHKGAIFIACGASKIAFFVHHPGFFLASTGMLLARHDLDEVKLCVFRPARTGESRMIFEFTRGQRYEMEVQLPHRGKAHRIAEAIDQRLQAVAA